MTTPHNSVDFGMYINKDECKRLAKVGDKVFLKEYAIPILSGENDYVFAFHEPKDGDLIYLPDKTILVDDSWIYKIQIKPDYIIENISVLKTHKDSLLIERIRPQSEKVRTIDKKFILRSSFWVAGRDFDNE